MRRKAAFLFIAFSATTLIATAASARGFSHGFTGGGPVIGPNAPQPQVPQSPQRPPQRPPQGGHAGGGHGFEGYCQINPVMCNLKSRTGTVYGPKR
jgi:hypothetical protein